MNYLLILLTVSLAVSALGWIYFIYFFSIGYGFSIAALAITLTVLFLTGYEVYKYVNDPANQEVEKSLEVGSC